jgi:hypothetical protein
MCWNREVSLATGTSSVVLSLFLLLRGRGNDAPIALLSMAVALMQFAEVRMWEFQETRDLSVANQGAHLGITALFLQPLLLGTATIYLRTGSWIATAAFVATGIAVAAPLYWKMIQKSWIPPATVGCNGHLEWHFTEEIQGSAFGIFYWIVMLGAWVFLRPAWEGLLYGGLAIGSVLTTIALYPGEWGSLWCFLANGLPLLRLLIGMR